MDDISPIVFEFGSGLKAVDAATGIGMSELAAAAAAARIAAVVEDACCAAESRGDNIEATASGVMNAVATLVSGRAAIVGECALCVGERTEAELDGLAFSAVPPGSGGVRGECLEPPVMGSDGSCPL